MFPHVPLGYSVPIMFPSLVSKGGPGRESRTEGRLVSSLGNPLKNFFLGGHMIFVQLWHVISTSQTGVQTCSD